MGIRGKIFLFVIPLVTLPLLLTGGYAYRFLLAGFQEQVYLESEQLCSTAAGRIEQELDDCYQTLLLFAATIDQVLQSKGIPLKDWTAPDKRICDMARNLAIRFGPYMHLHLVRADGRAIFSTDGISLEIPGRAPASDIFLQVVSAGGHMGFPKQLLAPKRSSLGAESPKPDDQLDGMTTFAKAVIDKGALAGMTVIDLHLASFSQILDQFGRAANTYYFLFDGSGALLAEGGQMPHFTSEPEAQKFMAGLEQLRQNPAPEFVEKRIAGDQQHFLAYTRPVKEYISFDAPVPGERWYLGMVRTEIPLLANFRKTRVLFFIALGLGLALAIGGTIFVSRRITTPIARLRDATREYARGNLDARLAVPSRDELGQLAAHFNRMAEDLARLFREKQLNEALVTVGRFSSSLAHDLRNPIEGLKLLSGELLRRCDQNPEQREMAETIHQSVENLASLLRESLDFARLHQPERRAADLLQITHQALDGLPLEQIALETRFPETLPPVHVDAPQIQRVLSNILKNAIEACTGKKARIQNYDPAVHLSIIPVEGEIIIEIKDNGPGISPEKQERIFEPFYSGKPGGHGLGLAFARQIIANHRGKISLQSSPGSGTTFRISLPVNR